MNCSKCSAEVWEYFQTGFVLLCYECYIKVAPIKGCIQRRVKLCHACGRKKNDFCCCCLDCSRTKTRGTCKRCKLAGKKLLLHRGQRYCHPCLKSAVAAQRRADAKELEAYRELGSYEELADWRCRMDIEKHCAELQIE